MRKVAIIQARVGSTRLPRKVLLQLGDGTVLQQVVNRVRAAPGLDDVVVATTVAPADDAIVGECERLNFSFFRGSEEDVLGRYFGAAEKFNAGIVIRITADCPLFDGSLLGRMLAQFDCDYLSNVVTRTFPRGLDTEIFTFSALAKAFREAQEPYSREHVTPYFYQHPELFNLKSFEESPDLSHHRWTLDTPEDWHFIQAVYSALHKPDRRFTTEEVLNLLRRRPELATINAGVQQKSLTQK